MRDSPRGVGLRDPGADALVVCLPRRWSARLRRSRVHVSSGLRSSARSAWGTRGTDRARPAGRKISESGNVLVADHRPLPLSSGRCFLAHLRARLELARRLEQANELREEAAAPRASARGRAPSARPSTVRGLRRRDLQLIDYQARRRVQEARRAIFDFAPRPPLLLLYCELLRAIRGRTRWRVSASRTGPGGPRTPRSLERRVRRVRLLQGVARARSPARRAVPRREPRVAFAPLPRGRVRVREPLEGAPRAPSRAPGPASSRARAEAHGLGRRGATPRGAGGSRRSASV